MRKIYLLIIWIAVLGGALFMAGAALALDCMTEGEMPCLSADKCLRTAEETYTCPIPNTVCCETPKNLDCAYQTFSCVPTNYCDAANVVANADGCGSQVCCREPKTECEAKNYVCVGEDFLSDFVNCNSGFACEPGLNNICCEREKTAQEKSGQLPGPTPSPVPTPGTTGGTAGTTSGGTAAAEGTVNPFAGLNFLSEQVSPNLIIQAVITMILGVVGAIALLFFVYGGAMYLIARGDAKYVEKGKKTIIWATLGLVLIFGSYIGISYLFQYLAPEAPEGGAPTGPTAETIKEISGQEKETCETAGFKCVANKAYCYDEQTLYSCGSGSYCCRAEVAGVCGAGNGYFCALADECALGAPGYGGCTGTDVICCETRK